MTMCGSLPAGSQGRAAARLGRSGAAASASSTPPRVDRSTAATAAERANLETYLFGWNSSSRSVGTAKESTARAPKHSIAPATAGLRRTRNGSSRHSSTSSGIASSTARPTFQARPGMIVSRNEKVSTSMIITSTNVTVIIRMLCLNCDSRMRMTIIASDSAAEVTGRRSSTSQKKLSKPQVRTKAAAGTSPVSDQSSTPSAARWMAASSAIRRADRRSAATTARRFSRKATTGGMDSSYSRVAAPNGLVSALTQELS